MGGKSVSWGPSSLTWHQYSMRCSRLGVLSLTGGAAGHSNHWFSHLNVHRNQLGAVDLQIIIWKLWSRFCISDELPDDVDNASPQTTLRVAKPPASSSQPWFHFGITREAIKKNLAAQASSQNQLDQNRVGWDPGTRSQVIMTCGEDKEPLL